MITAFTDNQQIDETYIPTEQDWEDVFAEESKFLFIGWNTRRQRTEVVAYMAHTAQEAWDTCARNCPDLQVARWDLADHLV